MKARNCTFFLSFYLLLFCVLSVDAQKEQSKDDKRAQIETDVKKLLDDFLINEDMEALGALLHDSLDFVWPSVHHFNKLP